MTSPDPRPTHRPGTASRRCVLEVRPADGGEDAVSFAETLFTALCRHAAAQGASVTPHDSDQRMLTAEVSLPAAQLDWAAGTHRLQHNPKTDRRGRRHTSSATVVVLPTGHQPRSTFDERDVELTPYRASGPGGQHRNKNATAIRGVHLPTGLTAVAATRSQATNRTQVLEELRRRVERAEASQVDARRGRERGRQLHTGGAKAFTHNAQRDETVDHTTGRRWQMRRFLAGRIG